MTKIIFSFLLSVLLISSTSLKAGDYPADIQKIVDKKKIVIAMYEHDQSPFFMKSKNGELVGFDVDLAKGIANELGVEVVFNRSAKSFNETVELVIDKKADIVISKLSRTLSRSKKVLFTKPYIVLRKGLLVNRLRLAQSKKGVSTFKFIKNFTGDLGVMADSSYVGFAKKMFPNAKIVEFALWEEITAAVIDGRVTAGFRDELEIKKIIKSASDQVIKLQSIVFKDTKDPIAIAVSSDARHLRFWLNQYLDTLSQDITADNLLEKFKHHNIKASIKKTEVKK
ncbi:MAG: amino acid ABC transporter substrate-binding protein [Desulfobacterales bacterium]|nr:amino acid ABC transporter substrate-binding protein [Desulfobacterales bacterium]MCP4158696.1 amino acid ABC transporter substrate-binding protein [Deltaproteobacteria bacterium]